MSLALCPVRCRRRRRLPLAPRFAFPPSFGFVYASFTLPLVFLLGAIWFPGPNYHGIWISVPSLSSGTKLELWAGKLVLKIDSKRRLYLNSKRISQKELKDALVNGLARRADRVVFLEGDDDLEYRDVVSVMDRIRAARAKIILLTPRARAEAK